MHGTEATNVSFGKIQHIITQSLKSVQNVLINDKHCVELYGYDVMIDQDLKPWLIEVNASPALSSDNERDYELKFNLIEDFYTCLVRDQAPSLLLVGGLEAFPVRRRLSSALGHSFDFWRLRVACAGYGEGVPRADAQTRGRL